MRIFKGFMKFVAACICLGVMVGSVLAVLLSLYAVEITANDAELLDLTNLELAQTSQLLARDHDTGEWVVVEEWHDSNDREWVDLQEIESNPYLKWAFICVEDKDFYEHSGVNFKRTFAAGVNYIATKLGFPIYDSMQGASTLDQQLIKNILGDDDVSVDRKLREIFRALGLDKRYDKDTILEAYLNTVSLSGSIAGVKAGASNYFGIEDLAQLSAAECASIAAITKNPTGYNPYTNPEQHLQRRNWILQLMHEQGKLTDSEYNDAVASPLVLAEEKEAEVVTTSSNNSYFADAVYKMLQQQLQDELGYTAAEAHNLIYNGGLRIYTTMDPYIQEEMEKIMLNADDAIPALWHEEEILQSQVPEPSELENIVVNDDGTYKTGTNKKGEPVYYYDARTQAAMLTMDYSGQVLALVGGLGEKTTDLGLNRAVAPEYGGTQRQIGSTMKPLAAYSLGIDSGLIHYSSALPDLGVGKIVKDELQSSYPQYGSKMFENDAPEVLANPGIWKDWPRNYEGYGEGALVTVNNAIATSKNTIAVRVGQRVGKDYMYSFAHDTLGMTHLTEADADYAPIVLGSFSEGVSLMELTGAYQMFGNGGEYVTPHLYTIVENAVTGEVLLDNTVNVVHTQAIKPSSAMIMNRLLQGVLAPGGTAGTSIKPAGNMEAAAKTGTTTENNDFTFVGLTPYYVTGVWWGYDLPYDMTDINRKQNAKPIQKAWKQLMDTVQADLEEKSFPVSDDVQTARYCADSGELAVNCPNTAVGYYTADNMPGYCTMHP